jgi:hypothetical protein
MDEFPFTASVRVPLPNASLQNWIYNFPTIEGERFVFSLSERPIARHSASLNLVVTNKRTGSRFFDFVVLVGLRHAARARLEFSTQRTRNEIALSTSLLALLSDESAVSQDYLNLTITIFPVSNPSEPLHSAPPLMRSPSPPLAEPFRRSSPAQRQALLGEYSDRPEYIGLPNEGATCYLNSILQALFHLPIFRRSIFETVVDDLPEQQAGIIMALQDLFLGMQRKARGINTRRLTSAFGWSWQAVHRPEDAEEFYRFLLGHLKKNSLNLFEIVRRMTAGDTGLYSDEILYSLQLIVKNTLSVQESFERMISPEIVGESFRTFMFVRLPMILILTLERFAFNEEEHRYQKLNSYYEFPEFLDLSRFAPLCPHSQYELASVLVHSGNMNIGHYIVYSRPTPENQWYEFNDKAVRQVDRATVLDGNFGGRTIPSSAYLLVYVQQSARHSIFCEIPQLSRPEKPVKYIAPVAPQGIDICVTTEDSFRKNARHLREGCTSRDNMKILNFEIGLTYKEAYNKIAVDLHKSVDSIRIWTVGPLKVAQVALENVDTIHINETMARTWFVQNCTDGDEWNDDSILLFIHFFFHNTDDPLQFITSRIFRKETRIEELFGIVSSMLGFTSEAPMLCYFVRRGIATRFAPEKSLNDCMFPNGSCLCFQFDPACEDLPVSSFTQIVPHEVLFGRRRSQLSTEDIPVVSTIPDVVPQTVDIFLSQYFNVSCIRIFHMLHPTEALLILEQPMSDSVISFKNRVAECSGCLFDATTDMMLFYSGPTSRHPINDQYFTQHSDLYFLVLPRVSPMRYEEMMKIHVRYREIQIEFPIGEDETIAEIQSRLVDTGVLAESANVRFLRISASRIEGILSSTDRLVSEKYELRIEDIDESERDMVSLFVSLATLDRGSLSCYGQPFVAGLREAELVADLQERLCSKVALDARTVCLAVAARLDSLKDVHYLESDRDVAAQIGDNRHIYILPRQSLSA